VARTRHAAAAFSLARWLGPWASPGASPRDVRERRVLVEGTPSFDARLFSPPSTPVGALLLVPGLHFHGPGDPRFERFARVLAASGFVVFAPFLPAPMALRADPRTADDLVRAWRVFLDVPERPRDVQPGVFSISFGALPALLLAAREPVGGLVVFGGYADFAGTLRFAVTGDGHEAPDPLNLCAIFLNIVDAIPGAPADPSRLVAAWHRFATRTWGRPELRTPEMRFKEIAREIAAELPAEERELFLVGCRVEPGAEEIVAAALARLSERARALDADVERLSGIRAPVWLVHGAEDDVIPVEQLDILARRLPPGVLRGAFTTGLYGHTAHAGLGALLARGAGAVREARVMAGMLGAIVSAGTAPAE